MAIVDMCKISILSLKKDRDIILDKLLKLGCIEITDEIDTPLKSPEAEALLDSSVDNNLFEVDIEITNVNSVINYLEEHDTRKKGMLYIGQEISQEDIDKIKGKLPFLKETIKKIMEYDKLLSDLRSKETISENLIQSLKPWISYVLPLSINSTKHTSIVLGTIPADFQMSIIEAELYKEYDEIRLSMINQDKDEYYLVLVSHKNDTEKAIDILKKYGFGRVHLSDINERPGIKIELLEKEILEIHKEREKVFGEIGKLSNNIGDIEIYHDYLLMEKEKSLIQKNMRSTKATVLIEGWMPKAFEETINEEIKDKYTCVISTLEPGKDEERPILLKNKGMADATELITEMYSLPNHKELDPNIIMAPFYIAFFGIMLGDAGYGIIITVLCASLLWKVKLKSGMKKIMKLLLFCGVSTIICGVLFGSFFGNAISVISGEPINTAIWFDPILLPEKMLIFSLALGVFQIFIGLGIKGYNMIKKGKVLDAIIDTLSWYLFFGGATMSVLPMLPTINVAAVEPLVQPGKILFGIGLLLLLTLQGRHSKNIIGKIFGGLPKLYDLIGFLSDVLSYSRLLSLGLATVVIAQVVNQIGSMMGLDNVIGVIFFIPVFLCGHLFNILLGTLSSYVHASRLQYMEFFSKFYEGGGRVFEPFKIKSKYTNYMNNTNRRQD